MEAAQLEQIVRVDSAKKCWEAIGERRLDQRVDCGELISPCSSPGSWRCIITPCRLTNFAAGAQGLGRETKPERSNM